MARKDARVALVFDWMTNQGGAEKVNLKLHRMFPKAPIYTSVFNAEKVGEGFEDADIRTSFIQRLPFAKKKHQWYLNMMPYAYESFDLSQFDIVISSSHSCSKGIITKPETMHVCYCHTPMRYLWDDWHSYVRDYKMPSIIKRYAKKVLHKLRIWDKVAADRVDYFVSNSKTTQRRVDKYYRRPSTVIHPMIDASKYEIAPKTKGYFLAVGRLIPYKKFDLIVNTFNTLGLPLKIVGTGIAEKDLKKVAKPNIEFLGFTDEATLKKLYSECEALIFPQLEDFGITPLEAMASGRPVIAYKDGGALETVIDGETGVFFNKQDELHLKGAVEKYLKEKHLFKKDKIREHAMGFDEEEFERKFSRYIQQKWESFTSSREI